MLIINNVDPCLLLIMWKNREAETFSDETALIREERLADAIKSEEETIKQLRRQKVKVISLPSRSWS